MFLTLRLLTIFIFLSSYLFGVSQIIKNDTAVKIPLKIKTIKMPKYPVADFPKKSVEVFEIQIIQRLRDSVQLGFILKGLDDHVGQLQPSKPLTILLQEHIVKMYKDDYKKNGVKILWVIKKLRIGERSGLLQYSYLKFNADSYFLTETDKYKIAATIDTVFFSESGADVTAWHGQEIEDAMKLLLKETLKNAIGISNAETTYSLEDINKLSTPQLNFPILFDTNYAEGAYKNFEEFLQNKPSVVNYEPVMVVKGKSKYITGFKNSNNDSIKIWGVCKNGDLYKYTESQLVSLEKSGNGFIVSTYAENTNKRNNDVFMKSVMGGLAGGLIGLSTANKGSLLVKTIPGITKASKQPDACVIDMDTGELAF